MIHCVIKQHKELRMMAAQVQHLMASLHDIEALATAVKADAAQSCKASPSAIYIYRYIPTIER